jgi:hypothetical protein
VTAVFHGHAHRGAASGALANGTPVYNVSFPLLLRIRPEQPFHLLDYEVPDSPGVEPGRTLLDARGSSPPAASRPEGY